MKLSNKTFFIFLAVLFACGCLIPLILWSTILIENDHLTGYDAAALIFITFSYIMTFLMGGLCALCVYKGDQWYKLAGYMLLFTSLIVFICTLAISIVSCGRPNDILFIPLWLLGIWIATSVLPTIIAAYITKSLIDRHKDKTDKDV